MRARLERLRDLADRLTSSLWFIPGLLVLSAVLLAAFVVWLDTTVGPGLLTRYPQVFGTGSQASRTMLSAIAQSMITVAGVTFSITIVAVAQASSQYTSRILRNFMSDRANQFVLGVFLGVFTYCLVVIRTTRGLDDFRPALSTLVAFLLAIIGIGVLIYFIHHIAESLQAEYLLARVSRDTVEVIDQQFPHDLGKDGARARAPELDVQLPADAWRPVASDRTGYVQAVDTQGLQDLAGELKTLIRMDRGIGDFVVSGESIVSLADGARADDGICHKLNRVYLITRQRSLYQDVDFGIRQMVDVAVKALSPGVNDTTTAIVSIDHLSAVLVRLAPRAINGVPRPQPGQPGLLPREATFQSFVDTAFDEIRRNAAGNVNVLERMLGAIELVAQFTTDAGRRNHLRIHVDRIADIVARSVAVPLERAVLEERCARLRLQLN
jgi:uncharacterized membrane protein